jgi:hypothetical protein
MFKDRYQNLYLVCVDQRMFLKVYNITNYYVDFITKPIKFNDTVFTIDLFSKLGDSRTVDPERTCNNLVQVNRTLMMCLCKSTLKANGKALAIRVFFQIINARNGEFFVESQISSMNYDDQRDGKVLMYKYDSQST